MHSGAGLGKALCLVSMPASSALRTSRVGKFSDFSKVEWNRDYDRLYTVYRGDFCFLGNGNRRPSADALGKWVYTEMLLDSTQNIANFRGKNRILGIGTMRTEYTHKIRKSVGANGCLFAGYPTRPGAANAETVNPGATSAEAVNQRAANAETVNQRATSAEAVCQF